MESEGDRPDHGDTQVCNLQTLQVGKRYIFHYRDQNGREGKDTITVTGPPSRKETTFQYPPGTATIKIESSFRDPFGLKGTSVRIISLADLSLVPYPEGTWEQNRWLEDPTKKKNGHADHTQPNPLRRIIAKLTSK